MWIVQGYYQYVQIIAFIERTPNADLSKFFGMVDQGWTEGGSGDLAASHQGRKMSSSPYHVLYIIFGEHMVWVWQEHSTDAHWSNILWDKAWIEGSSHAAQPPHSSSKKQMT